MNGAVLPLFVAAVAVGVVIVVIVVSVVPMNDSAAALAGRIVIIVARVAERRTVCACIVVSPDSVASVFAGDSFAVVAFIAKNVTIKGVVVIGLNRCSAATANGACIFGVVHGVVLLSQYSSAKSMVECVSSSMTKIFAVIGSSVRKSNECS